MDEFITVTCKSCSWVHFAVTRKHAEEQVLNMNEYLKTLTPKERKTYYGSSRKTVSIVFYEHCSRCGEKYKNFRISAANDCPDGCTLSPIIHFDED